MMMTCTDSDLLHDGNVNSIYLEQNTDDITEYEFEHHIIVSTNTCIGCDLRGFSMKNQFLMNIDFSESDLSNSDFTDAFIYDAILTDAILDRSNFTNSNFNNCTLTHASFRYVKFKGASFTIDESGASVSIDKRFRKSGNSGLAFQQACPIFDGADFSGLKNSLDDVFPVDSGVYDGDAWWNDAGHCMTSMKNVTMDKPLFSNNKLWQFINAAQTDFTGINLDGAVFSGDMTDAVFTGVSLKKAVFMNAKITGADLSGADLTGARFNNILFSETLPFDATSTLAHVNFSGSIMNNCDLSDLDLNSTTWYAQDYTTWDRKTSVSLEAASLFNSLLHNTKLNEADLSGADLSYVTWYNEPDVNTATGEKAVLQDAKFNFANLLNLNLNGANLKNASFDNAVLVNTSLTGLASLEGASFYKADLRGADFGDTTSLNRAKLAGATISVNEVNSSEYFKVMSVPPESYAYLEYAYGGTTLPASSVGVDSCPNGSVSGNNDCGPVTDSGGNLTTYWIPFVGLDKLTGCELKHGGTIGTIGVDSNGDYVECGASQRNPTGG